MNTCAPTPTTTTTAPPVNEITPRRASLIAGIGYLIIFVAAFFANFIVLGGMGVDGDAAATVANITDNEAMFRLGLIAFLAVFLTDVVIAWALWILFRDISRELSRLTAWMRLVYTGFLGVAVISFFAVLQLLSGASWLSTFNPGQIDAQVMLALSAFDAAWLVGLAAFGVHLILLGTMIIRTAVAPRALGILLGIAGVAYILDTAAHGLVADYADYANLFLAIVAVPSVIGELWFTFWLLLRGGKERAFRRDRSAPREGPRMKARVLESVLGLAICLVAAALMITGTVGVGWGAAIGMVGIGLLAVTQVRRDKESR